MRVGFMLNYRFNSVYRKFLIDLDMDFCGYMAETQKFDILLRTIMPVVERYSNINHPCPYSGNVTVRKMRITNKIFDRAILPSGQYRIDVSIYDSKEKRPIIFCKIFMTVPIANDARLDTAMG